MSDLKYLILHLSFLKRRCLFPLLFSLLTYLTRCQLLCNTDDTKLFLKISSINDCARLQENLINFVEWSATRGLKLSIKEFRSMIFAKSWSSISFSYCINDVGLFSINTNVYDLSFTSNLDSRTY